MCLPSCMNVPKVLDWYPKSQPRICSLELELQVVLSHHVNDEKWTWVLCKSDKCFTYWPISPAPLFIILLLPILSLNPRALGQISPLHCKPDLNPTCRFYYFLASIQLCHHWADPRNTFYPIGILLIIFINSPQVDHQKDIYLIYL